MFDLFVPATAYAQGAGGAAGGTAGGGFNTFVVGMLPFIPIFILFYVLLILPQQRRQKAHRKLIEELKKGDKVITTGGILGTVVAVTKDVVTVQVSDNTRLKILRPEIAGLQDETLGKDS